MIARRVTIAIPIHNERAELVAYAGRAINDSEPRYRLPTGFHKSHLLYNLHRVATAEVVIVEGFFDCMKVWQSLHPFVVVAAPGAILGANHHLVVSAVLTASPLSRAPESSPWARFAS